MPKPVYATIGDVEAIELKVNQGITKCEALIAPAIDNSEQRLQAAIQKVTDTVAANAATQMQATDRATKECKKYSDDSCKNLHEQIAPQFPALQANVDAVEKRLLQKAQEVKDFGSTELARTIEELCANFTEELNGLKSEILGGIGDTKAETMEVIKQQREELDGRIDTVKKDMVKMVKLLQEKTDKTLADYKETQAARDAKQDEENQLMQNEIFLKLGRHDDQIKEEAEKAAANLKKTEDLMKDMLEDLRLNHGNRLDHLDAEADKLRNAVAEVENVATKKVDWVIQNVSRRIRPTSASKASLHRSWFSPKFNIAGAHGLQLELQFFRQSDPPAKDEECGDAAVFLWACKGMNLSYRLYIGNKYQTIEKMFNGRVPFGTKRFCFLKDQINKQDDTLKVSVEILESHREIQHTIEVPPDPELPVGVDPPEKALDGHVYFHRHINNRLYDQVKQEVDLMRSRMVRKIQWRLEHASKLRGSFPVGDCMCSTQFNAAGLEGLQLIFYPSGYNGASEGFCSLYLYGPAGATLKCTLCLGNQKRDATHVFTEPGAFGRTNYCRFEQIVDEDTDTVLVGLEVTEAHQDSVANVAHPKVSAGDKRTQGQMDGVNSHAINSIVKLQSSPGKAAEGLEDVRVLPSLWTAQFKDSMTMPSDGMHSFDELAGKSNRGARRGGAQAPSEPMSPEGSRGMGGSTSMPSLTPGGGRGFDAFAATTGGSGFGTTKGGPGRRPRRAGMASTTQSQMGLAC